MKKNLFLFSMLGLITFLVSCNKETDNTSDIYAESVVEDVQLETRSGNGDCFELVWPVTISFPDGTTQEVNSREEMKAAIVAWRSQNPDVKRRPSLVYPVEVMTEDGEVVTVENAQQMLRLKKACIKRPHNGDKRPCFRLNYPLTLVFPDGTTQSYDDARAMKNALRRWKQANPTATTYPIMQWPITITMKDGTVVEVTSKEQLRQIKEDCN